MKLGSVENRIVWKVCCAATFAFLLSPAFAQEKVSSFGEYAGYSQPRFTEWINSSQYIEMRDGVKLALDIVRPAIDGQAVEEKLPVVWTHSRYHRSPQAVMKQFGSDQADQIKSMVDAQSDLQRLVRHGYVVASVGVRGSGASFGRYEGLLSPNETQDAYEITEWLARQPWCDGKVGMHGASYLGMTQYMAASKAPPSLKAIFPNVAGFDLFDVIYPGGVYRQDMVEHWGGLTRQLDLEWMAPRVDVDTDSKLLESAIEQHRGNWDVVKEYRKTKFRDIVAGGYSFMTHNPASQLTQINQAQVPAYHWCGWYDIFVTDATLWFTNYKGPQKLAIGSWPHAATPDPKVWEERLRLRSAEQHRWFDYWLKGIDNGIMDEPPVNIATLDDPGKWSWSSATNWPLRQTETMSFFLSEGASRSVESTNDGLLVNDQPRMESASDAYKIDFSTTTGTATRWDNAVGVGPMRYPDMTANDKKCLTYTTEPLGYDVNVTGHANITLYIESSADDADIYVLLEEVDADGKSHYVTEGVLRASHRKQSRAPWNNIDLPYQRSFQSDQSKLSPATVIRIDMDLHPVSNIFNKNHRIRVAIMGADQDNTEPPPVPEGTVLTVHRNKRFASVLRLPIVEETK